MNTYNIKVNGVSVIQKINKEELEENLKLIRGLVWTSGGNDECIEVSINRNENHCND
jgi:hypothetical protein